MNTVFAILGIIILSPVAIAALIFSAALIEGGIKGLIAYCKLKKK